MIRLRTALLPLLLVVAAPAAGQTVVTPPRGSPLRSAIVDALRVPVQRELGRAVIFEISELRVGGGWAFLSGVPRAPNGAPLDYRGTPYQEAVEEGMFDDGIVALLRLRGGRWTVVASDIGATDVPWVEWPKEHGAPRAIFPFPD